MEKNTKDTKIIRPNGKELIYSPEGEVFTLRLIEDPDDPIIEQMYTLIRTELAEDEVDTLAWVKYAIKETNNKYHIIQTSEDRIISASSTQSLVLKPYKDKQSQPRECILVVWCIVTEPVFRNKGLASALYWRFY